MFHYADVLYHFHKKLVACLQNFLKYGTFHISLCSYLTVSTEDCGLKLTNMIILVRASLSVFVVKQVHSSVWLCRFGELASVLRQ